MKKELVELLLKNKKIMAKIERIFELDRLMNNKILQISNLKLTIIEYREFLQKEVINQFKKINYAIKINTFLSKIDAILPTSIGDYRPENWIDNRLVASSILENSRIELGKKLVGLKFFNSFKLNSINTILHNNRKILSDQPLTEWELNDLNKRVIFGFFGGIANIANIELAKYKFNIDCTTYEKINENFSELAFLKINVKDESKILQNKYLKNDWDEQLRYYYDHLKNGILTYQLDTIANSYDPQKYEQIKIKLFQDEKLKNNHLVVINYSWANEKKINKIINEWKVEILDDNKVGIEEELWKEKIMSLIKEFKQKIIKLVEIEDLKIKLKSYFYEYVESFTKDFDIKYANTNEGLDDIFNILYHQYQTTQQVNATDNFNIIIDSDSDSDSDFTNVSSTSSGIYQK